MSLPAYLFLYDENGMQVPGESLALGRLGAIEVMNSSYGVRQPVDGCTGSMTGARVHDPVIIHKQIDKLSPYLAVAVCESKRLQKAIIKYYETKSAGIEEEVYSITLEGVVISSVDFTHVYYPGSTTPNMNEVVGLRFRSIEWKYVRGNISYDDAWMKPAKKEEQKIS
ncbi:type VI secretion system tube protein Hcp [Citrobacter amalonaticus]|uniref:Type VI secretion system tube protein Hcp n=1 Tax=Citrobacter amalonaticus TaxID=35703 RepID=A0A2S4S171_CITAM|nr:type VI secretion system tube protein TssD [Citrobacter amalonaticus]POT55271.1 type VI secretion system tube protein Hcp [Citrobacter amalonaticus]POT77121.1 type VI secretion system tube protein Hcp [Citrobacter amalonaticus]POU67572.1 type VI secretion system tube protein Hcp [Citrobacter amalonaticus]POV07177.1 type VI secretion system tube protein Hcp [Citrobacter amalonaticus]